MYNTHRAWDVTFLSGLRFIDFCLFSRFCIFAIMYIYNTWTYREHCYTLVTAEDYTVFNIFCASNSLPIIMHWNLDWSSSICDNEDAMCSVRWGPPNPSSKPNLWSIINKLHQAAKHVKLGMTCNSENQATVESAGKAGNTRALVMIEHSMDARV